MTWAEAWARWSGRALPEAVDLAARELAAWGYPGRRRAALAARTPLNAGALGLDAYEAGRPSAAEACRIGDARVLAGRALSRRATRPCASAFPCRLSRTARAAPDAKAAAGAQQLDVMLVGAQPPGAWVLAFQGSALRVLCAEEAAQIERRARCAGSGACRRAASRSVLRRSDRSRADPARRTTRARDVIDPDAVDGAGRRGLHPLLAQLFAKHGCTEVDARHGRRLRAAARARAAAVYRGPAAGTRNARPCGDRSRARAGVSRPLPGRRAPANGGASAAGALRIPALAGDRDAARRRIRRRGRRPAQTGTNMCRRSHGCSTPRRRGRRRSASPSTPRAAMLPAAAPESIATRNDHENAVNPRARCRPRLATRGGTAAIPGHAA